jgi:hypothetical protein
VTWRLVHCSDPEGLDADDRLVSWKDDAPVREVRTAKGTTRLIYEDGRDREVIRR